MKKTILVLVILAAVVGGCKKYEEGPLISFRSAESRLYGIHKITSYTINGEDSLSLYYDSLANYIQIEFDKAELDINLSIWGSRNDGEWSTLNCSCGLRDKNKTLMFFHCGGDIGTGPFSYYSINVTWEILRLTNKELKMKTTLNGKEYVVEMEKEN